MSYYLQTSLATLACMAFIPANSPRPQALRVFGAVAVSFLLGWIVWPVVLYAALRTILKTPIQ